jgi:hypothetical protein
VLHVSVPAQLLTVRLMGYVPTGRLYIPPVGAGGLRTLFRGPPLPGVLPASTSARSVASAGCAAQPAVAGRSSAGAQTAVGGVMGTVTEVMHELTLVGVVGVEAVSVI